MSQVPKCGLALDLGPYSHCLDLDLNDYDFIFRKKNKNSNIKEKKELC